MEGIRAKLCFLRLTLFLLISLCSSARCRQRQKEVLIEIKNKFNPKDSAFSDWDPQNTSDCCNWSGVSCNSKAQINSLGVRLDSFGPALQVPAAIGDLPFLEGISIFGNLTGPIPTSITGLQHLQTLQIGSGLTGHIPPSFGRLKRLTYLDLSLNSLTGSIPSSLGQLADLTSMDLSHNKLSGSIPASLGRLVRIEELSLASNRLSGPIPASLALLTQASTINLQANQLSGPVPASFGAFKNPDLTLILGINQLSGPLPESLGQANVSTMDLSQNRLSGDASLLFGNDKTA